MTIIRKSKAELKRFRLTKAELERLDAMTDAEVIAAAKSDADNPPMTAAELKRMRRPGRPPLPARRRKQNITIRIDPGVADWFRATGRGWQTRIGVLLAKHAARGQGVKGR
jgi:uncharacterized protein (DUF4415 family)